MPYYFFLSYSRRDADKYLDTFFHDLRRELSVKTAINLDEAGYRDTETPLGSDWSQATAEALATCKVFVPLYSPNFFTTDFCGREWTAFMERVRAYQQAQGAWPSVILPVWWVSFMGEPPAVVRDVQDARDHFDVDYRKHGARYLIARGRAKESVYREFLDQFTDMMIEAAKQYALPQGRVSDLSRVPSAWGVPRSGSVLSSLPETYQALPDFAAALFRRGTIIAGEVLDSEIADLLVDGKGQEAIDVLLASSMLTGLPNGRADYPDEVRSFAERMLKDREDQETIKELGEKVRHWLLVNRPFSPDARISRDYWTTQDRLNYAPYADAIAAFIRHPSTVPPLTIGIKGSWGAGKTSLMRMVQQRLDPPQTDDGAPTEITLTKGSRQGLRRNWRLWRKEPAADAAVTNVEVLDRAHQASARATSTVLCAGPKDPETKLQIPGTDWRPTVWFNPWSYQTGEQVWAGLAHEIIRQVTGRMPRGDRERFWLELNLARLDRDAVRRRAYRAVWERVLPFLIVFALSVVVSLSVFAIRNITATAWLWLSAVGGAFGGASGIALLGAVGSAVRFLGRAAGGPLGSLVQGPDLVKSSHALLDRQLGGSFELALPDPGYATKLGFLHLVQTDMKRVLGLVAREDQPLVIFVDDLDRCSPGTVAQVIEAINLFLAGEYPNCLFVLALEPALVAANVEVTYKDLVEVLKRSRFPGEWSSLGWRFLEKIVQLPLSLPPPPVTGGLDRYLETLLITAAVLGRSERSSHNSNGPPSGQAGAVPQGARAGKKSLQWASPRSVLRKMTVRSTRWVPGGTGTSSARLGQMQGQTPISATASDAGGRGTLPGLPNRALVEQIVKVIRARHPTIDTLPDVARRVQAEVVPETGADPLLPETAQAAGLVFADLYSDRRALAAIQAALPALCSSNPREIKRYVNLFRFYTFIVQRQRLDGLSAPSGDCIAKLAALAIRWPQLLSALGQAPRGQAKEDLSVPISVLEQAASESDDAWCDALRKASLTQPARDGALETLPEWSVHLRVFLATGPEVGNLAARLL